MAEARNPQDLWRHRGAAHTGAPAGAAPPEARRRRLRGVGLAAAMLAVAGVVVALLSFLSEPPRPLFLSIAVSEYQDRNLPPNPWAQQDGDALRALFPEDSVQAFQSQERHLIVAELARLVERTTRSPDSGRPVVVHLCAHARVSGGKAYLLPGFADPHDPPTWLPLEELLRVLRQGSGPRLLLLDVARPMAGARLGVVEDRTAAAVAEELTRLGQNGELPFGVLCACAAGQHSLAAPELRGSLFAYFLREGLRGAADGWNPEREKDRRISTGELVAYTRTQVARAAQGMGLPPQTPVLYGEAEDFVLMALAEDYSPPEPPSPAPEYPGWLAKAWARRDQWDAEGAYRRTPRAFRQLEAALLRAEARFLAGAEGENLEAVRKDLDAEQKALAKRRERFPSVHVPPRSLALAARQGFEKSDEVTKAVRPLAEKIKAAPPVKPEEVAALAKPLGEKWPEASPYPATATALFQGLLAIDEPTREQLLAFDGVFAALRPEPRYAEWALVRYLTRLNERQFRRWEPGTARLLLRTAELAEQAAAFDPRALPWLRGELGEADAMRREALAKLSVGQSTERAQARDLLLKAGARYGDVLRAAAALEDAFRQVDEALRVLTALAEEAPGVSDRDWDAAVRAAGALLELLSPPKEPALPATEEVERQVNDLRVYVGKLREAFGAAELEKLIRRGREPGAADLRGLLASPLWRADQRPRIAAAAAEAAAGRWAEVLDAVRQTPVELEPPAARAVGPAGADADARRRARRAIDLLRLAGGVEEVAALEQLLARVAARPSPEGWGELGEKIREAWAVSLPARYRAQEDPEVRARWGWVIHPFDLEALPPGEEDFPREPVPLLRRDQQRKYSQWLGGERYARDAEAAAALQTDPAAAYARALDELARDFRNWNP